MRAIITGINGFVGQHLARELRQHGWDVFGFSDKEPFGDTTFEGDLLNQATMMHALEAGRPDVVFHLAGFTSVSQSWKNPDVCMRVNRDGTDILYQAIRKQDHPISLLLTSSAEVYGPPQSPAMSETHQINPQNPYSRSKLEQERLAEKYPEVPTVVCRSFPHTGPGQAPVFVTSDFARQIVRGEHDLQDSIVVGNLDAQRDFTDVRDTVRAYRLLVEKKCFGEVFNVCSNTAYSMKWILDRLLKLARPGLKMKIVTDQEKMRPSDIPVLRGDNVKVKQWTGWQPTMSIDTTLHDILEYWRHADVAKLSS